jgi:CheY-like chemotaxis protein
MGAVGGNEILYLVKEADATKPVILMTGRIEYTTEKAKEEGFDGFLQKPFNMKQLEAMFGAAADNKPEETQACSFADDFPAFSAMMDNDEDAIRQILTVFVQSTADDLLAMNTCIETSKFVEAQDLCHKILPMFTQLERDTTFLAKMNTLRGQGKKEKHYRRWKDDALRFMQQADELMDLLAEKYGIG